MRSNFYSCIIFPPEKRTAGLLAEVINEGMIYIRVIRKYIMRRDTMVTFRNATAKDLSEIVPSLRMMHWGGRGSDMKIRFLKAI